MDEREARACRPQVRMIALGERKTLGERVRVRANGGDRPRRQQHVVLGDAGLLLLGSAGLLRLGRSVVLEIEIVGVRRARRQRAGAYAPGDERRRKEGRDSAHQ